MESDFATSVIISTKLANNILPILYSRDDKKCISAKRVFKPVFSGRETSVNSLIVVAINIERDVNLLKFIAEFLYEWSGTHQDHTMSAANFESKIIYLSPADIFNLMFNSSIIYIH